VVCMYVLINYKAEEYVRLLERANLNWSNLKNSFSVI
jgi:hypothetical protein